MSFIMFIGKLKYFETFRFRHVATLMFIFLSVGNCSSKVWLKLTGLNVDFVLPDL